ncbi:hypothetical protein MIT9_P2441 [Methylomarinovum caldicuralii]|uniref:Choice-of-anchor A domain-containing protein n=1 Tax=Methylomarinovum caldicuralii TaxID=438856 RepID=A0AAU9CIK7_9GAMM|nr:choice-of-anchor A family protein [Methylomarinovum caldicuralii]BCX82850.1 hypothetical protein MIT9_P2441 [Methylomarinovum caldicuralii]
MNRIVCLLWLFLLPLTVQAISLGVAGRYNLVVLGDMIGEYSDVEGRVAVGGDATLSHYAVGQLLSDSDNFSATLVVGGDLIFHDGRVYHGNAYYGGSADIQHVGFYADDPAVPTGRPVAGAPLNFTALTQDLYDRSSAWAGLAANGSAWRDGSGTGWALHLAGSDPWLNVFDINASWLGGAYGLWLDVPLASTVLINVDGIMAELDNFGFFRKVDGGWLRVPDNPADRHDGSLTRRVLFNFFEAQDLSIHNIGVKGSILAPWAELSFYDAHIDGNLIVRSLQAPPVGKCGNASADRCSGQVNHYLFIPEPESLALLLAGLGVLIRWRRTEVPAGRC